MASRRKNALWKRIQKRLEASGKAESISAMSSKGATVPCMRLKDSGGVVGIDSTPVLQIPQRHQYLAQIEDAGPDGITRMDISLSQVCFLHAARRLPYSPFPIVPPETPFAPS